MASIAEWIEKIKTAIYGEEVRGAIWQSLDAMNTQVDAINVDSAQIEQNKTDIATNTAAITALNSSLTTFAIPMVTGLDTEAKIAAAYNEAHTSSPNQSWYRRLINHGTSYSVLGGGRYYLEGYRENAGYGWQRATSYATAQDTLPCKCYERSIINGTWSDWQKVPTRAEVNALDTRVSALENA